MFNSFYGTHTVLVQLIFKLQQKYGVKPLC